jgi:hypothetical protein
VAGVRQQGAAGSTAGAQNRCGFLATACSAVEGWSIVRADINGRLGPSSTAASLGRLAFAVRPVAPQLLGVRLSGQLDAELFLEQLNFTIAASDLAPQPAALQPVPQRCKEPHPAIVDAPGDNVNGRREAGRRGKLEASAELRANALDCRLKLVLD